VDVADGRLSAEDVHAAFEAAERWLDANRDGINAINVYPVPDGDTGTNMLLTLRAALRGAAEGDSPGGGLGTVGEYAARMSRAALLGARGNSGVILSQMIRGLSEALAERDDTSGPELAHALANASDTAYASVSKPVEGTMLTVLREASALALERMAAEEDAETLLRGMVAEAYASVERTPELLPRLREAGVVDAGGAGIAVLLEGVASGLFQVPLPDEPRYRAGDRVQTDAVEHEGHGYCTEFIVLGDGLDLRAIEAALTEAGGDSLLVVGDTRTAHVHVHLEDPGPALSIGARAGALESVKVENMQAQHEAWMAAKPAGGDDAALATLTHEAAPQPLGLVAVVRGDGLAAAFRDLGAGAVIQVAPGAKASAGEILEAARRAGTDHAIVLPNDGDILMAAETASRESEGFLTVVPSRSVAAGLAAAIAYHPTGEPAEVAAAMSEALEAVRCVEVSTSVRDASVDGVTIRTGDAIALVDGVMHAACGSHDEALLAGLGAAIDEAAALVTVYLGAEADADAEERVRALIEDAHPDVEVDVLPGGQPHYPYLASVE
jgi:uncharacterized protein